MVCASYLVTIQVIVQRIKYKKKINAHKITNKNFVSDKYAGHGDEMFLQFDFGYAQSLELNEDDSKVAHYINSLWTNFAKHEYVYMYA